MPRESTRASDAHQAPSAGATSPLPGAQPALVVHRAERWPDRLRGLLGSPRPAPGHALLITPCASVHTAFMRHPIDIVFVDRRGCILKVLEALPPWRAAVCWRARHTLELAAGEARRVGLVSGGFESGGAGREPSGRRTGAGDRGGASRGR